MKPLTKQQIIDHLKTRHRSHAEIYLYESTRNQVLFPKRWMPAVPIRKAVLKRIIELLKRKP